jgi:hypothetical protein
VRSAQARHQLSLGIEVTQVPEELLKAAYDRCRLPIPYEKAIEDPMYRKCLNNVAISGQLKRRNRR